MSPENLTPLACFVAIVLLLSVLVWALHHLIDTVHIEIEDEEDCERQSCWCCEEDEK